MDILAEVGVGGGEGTSQPTTEPDASEFESRLEQC